jgi:N-acyl-D-amino-acid deacylase
MHMRVLTAALLALLFNCSGLAQSLVLLNGRVVDGTGKAGIVANVRIRDGRVTDMGAVKPAAEEAVLDVKGMIVAPGLIDLQSLTPSAVVQDAGASALLLQGVTTAVLGADGSGAYSVEDFMLPFDEKPPAVNIAMLVGHATIRKQILGPEYQRPATADEIRRMGELVSDGMKQGAFGLGSDLRSEPASYSAADEVLALAKVVAAFGGTVILKLRNEEAKLADAVKEAAALARDAKVPVQVITTRKAALAEIGKARTQRVDIAADSYAFSEWIRDKSVTAERAIQRMASTPAARLALRERGVLKKGDPADIIVFNPQARADGMKFVFVNGTMVVKDGQPTGTRAGHALR